MKKWIKVLFWLGGVLLMLGAGSTVLASEAEPAVLKVAFPEAAGINEIYGDGTYGGCVYDWLEEIAKYTGWKYEFVSGDVNELMADMKTGAYDLMGGVYLLEGLDETYNFPKYIMGFNYSFLICREENKEIKSYDYTTLNGKRIGVWKKAAAKIERLEKFLDLNNIQCELVYYEVEEDYENCLETKAVDMMLGSDVHMKEHYNVAAQFEADPYYIVTAKDEPELCEQLSEAMEAIYEANPNFAGELYKKYFPDRYINTVSLTEEELAFIRQSGHIRVAVMKERYPLYYEQDGKVKGIIPECLELVSQRTGLSFEYLFADTYQELLDLVKQGDADIVGAFQNSDISAAEEGLARTVSYAVLDSVILRNKQSFGKTKGLIMAVPQAQDLEPGSSEDIICYYGTYKDCMKAVNSGEADYTRMPAAFIQDFYSKDYYANISLVADTSIQEELSLALKIPVNVPLYSILSKALNHFSAEESARILMNGNVTMRESTVTWKSLLYTNPVLVLGISSGMILLLSIIVILLIYSRARTKVMELKLEKAEETSRAKSDFLSRMSHEIRTPMNAVIGLTNLIKMTGEVTPEVDKNLSQIDSSARFLLSLLNDVLDMSKIDNQKMKLDIAPFSMNRLVNQIESMLAVQAQERGLTLEIVCKTENPFFVGDKMRLQQVLTNLLSNACKFTDKGGTVGLTIEEQECGEGSSLLRFCVRDSGIGIEPENLERIFCAFEQVRDDGRSAPGTGLGLAISSSLVELMGGRLMVESKPGSGSEFYFTVSLPISQGEPSEEELWDKQAEVRLEGMHILLAEDNDINAEIAMELLKSRKITVERVADGRQAVELFGKSSGGTYDAILMDINMPVMDGLEAAREIRAMKHPDAGTIPILAMTANTFQEDRDNAARAGMTGFLPKPFGVEQLYRILSESLRENNREIGKSGEAT